MLKIPQENLDEDVDDDRVAGSNAVCIGRTGAGGDLFASMRNCLNLIRSPGTRLPGYFDLVEEELLGYKTEQSDPKKLQQWKTFKMTNWSDQSKRF